MIVAVVAMPMMQPSIDQVVVMVPVGHQFMAAALMIARASHWRARRRIHLRNGNHVLIVMTIVRVVQMAIVQKIDVAFMLDASVATGFAVNVRVLGMLMAGRHGRVLRASREIPSDTRGKNRSDTPIIHSASDDVTSFLD
jgi:hypothetical protein